MVYTSVGTLNLSTSSPAHMLEQPLKTTVHLAKPKLLRRVTDIYSQTKKNSHCH